MADITVKKLAADLGYPTDKLLEQLLAAGIAVSGEEAGLSDEQKQKLLAHLTASAKPKLGAKKLSLGGKAKTSTADTGGVSVRKVRSVSTPSEPAVNVSEEAKKRQELVQAKIEEEKRLSEESNVARKKREAEIRAEKEALKKIIEAAKNEAEAAEKAPETEAQPEPIASDVKESKVEPSTKQAVEETPKAPSIQQQQPTFKEPEEVATKKKKNAPKVRKKELESTTLSAMELYEQEQEILRAAEIDAEKEAANNKQKSKKKVALPKNQHGFKKPTAPIVYAVDIPEAITVSDLAAKMSVKSTVVIKALMKLGMMVTINQSLDQDTAVIVVEELGHTANLVAADTVEDALEEDHHVNETDAKPRPPVVTIMGHVDHGKTSLLDYIRKAKVADGEAGGITQHIGAYRVQSEGETICFLDTPGHAAFTAMRSRGAKATDIVILVVAADDGVMPQTIEAIQHAKAAEVPIIVAINKIDKQGADPEKILGELAQHEVVTESWGGDILMAKVSAHTGEGIDDLLSQVLMQSEVLELKAPVSGAAKGVVVESRLDKGRGAVVTLLVQQGELKKGDMVLCGLEFGRVRAMSDDKGKTIQSAGPSTPVEIFGLSGVPEAGDDFLVTPNERKAREVALHRQEKSRETKLDSRSAVTLDNLFSQMEESQMGTVNIVLKADVNGSVEALKDALLKLSNSEVKVNIVGFGVGGISESDVTLATASNAILIAFNVRAEASARKLIEQEQVDVRYYSIIYEAIEQVKQALEGLLAPSFKEEVIGLAQVRDVFKSPKFGAIAGCLVMDGVVKKSNPIRVLRDNVVIYEGELESLRRFKDDVKEVQSGTECGIGVKNYNDVRAGDEIEVYERIEVKRTLESAKI